MLSNKAKSFLIIILKLLFGTTLFFVLRYQLKGKTPEVFSWAHIEAHLQYGGWVVLAFVFLLMGLNWGFEAKKWQLLLQKHFQISFLKSVKAVFAGITISTFTPNRTGEFAGRILFLPNRLKVPGIFLTLVGSLGQLTSILIFGSFGFAYYLYLNNIIHSNLLFVLVIMLAVISVISILLFLKVNRIVKWVPEKWLGLRMYEWLMQVAQISPKTLLRVGGFSSLRFLTYTSQLILMYHFWGATIPLIPAFLLTYMLFLCQTIIPSTIITDLGIRGSIALILFKSWSVSEQLFSAIFSVWFINLIIPSVLGFFFILEVNVLRNGTTTAD